MFLYFFLLLNTKMLVTFANCSSSCILQMFTTDLQEIAGLVAMCTCICIAGKA